LTKTALTALRQSPTRNFGWSLLEVHSQQGAISDISEILSLDIAQFFYYHSPSPEIFQQLTDEKFLPNNGTNAKAAVNFLGIGTRYSWK
jgi:hypothetical protein